MQSKNEYKFPSNCNAAMQRGDEESNKKRAGKEHDRPEKKVRSMRDKGQNNNYYFRRIKHMSTLL